MSRSLDLGRLGQLVEMIEDLHETWIEAVHLVEDGVDGSPV